MEKIQKITEALYRVTELYPDKEPLKWQLRTTAIELFDFLFSNEEKEIFDAKKAFDLIRRLTRFLQLAYASSAFVSSINFEVLRREYLSLSESLETQMESKKQEFLALQNLLPLSSVVSDVVSDTQPTPDSIGQTPDSNGQVIDSNGQNKIDNGHNGQKERKRRILDLLKKNNDNDWLTIREISASLPEYGEKSVQRDLLEMVEAGILKKAGDKRWRKYSLV